MRVITHGLQSSGLSTSVATQAEDGRSTDPPLNFGRLQRMSSSAGVPKLERLCSCVIEHVKMSFAMTRRAIGNRFAAVLVAWDCAREEAAT